MEERLNFELSWPIPFQSNRPSNVVSQQTAGVCTILINKIRLTKLDKLKSLHVNILFSATIQKED
ncbi:hypothetical protein SK128_015724 [Halocaridina rubra]|uniref:Uncharacterized protein n=1 Tax=Halocaridina rubra TaxID=373956 RepID=A0AAN9AFB9_HALRR